VIRSTSVLAALPATKTEAAGSAIAIVSAITPMAPLAVGSSSAGSASSAHDLGAEGTADWHGVASGHPGRPCNQTVTEYFGGCHAELAAAGLTPAE
jgi:hypothetical protein